MSSALRISHDKENWEIETKSSMLNRRINFKLGQEFSDGREARIRARVEDDSRLVMESVTGDAEEEEEVREFFINDDGDLVQCFSLRGNVTAERIYRRVKSTIPFIVRNTLA